MYRVARMMGSVRWLPHLIAMALSMRYAWGISQTPYVTTGLQFIAPLLLIMAVHLVWVLAVGATLPGYARVVLRRSMVTAIALAAIIPLIEIMSPQPSYASSELGDFLPGILATLFCLTVLSGIVAVTALAVFLSFIVLGYLVRWVFGKKRGGMNDLASLAVVAALIIAASLEGLPQTYTFETRGHATATVPISASTDAVWQTMQTATTPEAPLPALLGMFPQPVAVPVDEGTGLGARRVVVIQGREGRGLLQLKVSEQVDKKAVFKVVSDASPVARWIALRALSYEIESAPTGSLLHVSLTYDRLLSPSWAFDPMMRVAARLAMSVLAHDTKTRAEASEAV